MRERNLLAEAMHDMDTLGQVPWQDNPPWQEAAYYDMATELQSYMAAKGLKVVEINTPKERWWQMLWGRG